MEGFVMPELGEKDPIGTKLDENQKRSIHDQLVDRINFWTTQLKFIQSARIYIGGSKFFGPYRAENDSHFKNKPLGYSVGELAICKSIESLREAEHHVIKVMSEVCGQEKLLNICMKKKNKKLRKYILYFNFIDTTLQLNAILSMFELYFHDS